MEVLHPSCLGRQGAGKLQLWAGRILPSVQQQQVGVDDVRFSIHGIFCWMILMSFSRLVRPLEKESGSPIGRDAADSCLQPGAPAAGWLGEVCHPEEWRPQPRGCDLVTSTNPPWSHSQCCRCRCPLAPSAANDSQKACTEPGQGRAVGSAPHSQDAAGF